ncbi:MAG: J domain-containing protein, partial [Nitrososphaera sp.]
MNKRSATSDGDHWNYYSQNDDLDLSKFDCYSILGVTHNASIDEIKRAYRRLVLQYHPDRNTNPEAASIFRVIQMAFDVLTDKGRRKQYDSSIPSLGTMTAESRVSLVLEGAYSEGYVMDDRAAISIPGTNDAIVIENSVTIPTIWIHSQEEHRQYSLFSSTAFERLFRELYKVMEPNTELDEPIAEGIPEL